MDKKAECVIISTFKDVNLYFSVGVSPSSGKIVRIGLPQDKREESIAEISNFYPHFKLRDDYQEVAEKISKAYNGENVDFDGEKLEKSNFKTPFQRKVLLEVAKIPYGETRTYKNIADNLKTHGYRAVGSAIGKNPFPIVIPCHRVVRSDLTIGDYRGGSEMKKEILKREGVKISRHNITKK